MKRLSFYLAGEFVSSGSHLSVINPFTQQSEAEIALAEVEHINIAIDRAENCKKEYQNWSSLNISKALFKIAEGIDERTEEFAQTICAESAKPYKYAKGEVLRAIETFRIAAFEATRLPHELIFLDAAASGAGLKGRVEYFSAGIVAGISPFNFPLNLVAHKIAPAIATKSPIILKPSSKTPLTALLLAELIAACDLPKGAVSILPCSRQVGDALVTDPRIKVLSFTGSPDIGWDMKNRAGKKRVVLELGGNAAAIVHDDVKLNTAVGQLVVGAFAYSGQVCIHTQRIYVQEKVYNEFLSKFIEATKNLAHGAPHEKHCDFSVMIDESNAKRLELWLQEALEAGAKLVMGGKRKGLFFEPTIVSNTTKGMRIHDEEVFGPIVCVNPFSDLDDAIKQVNNSRFGLQAAIFSEHQPSIEKCFAELEVGAVITNLSTTYRSDQMPYGGVKDSGFGREGVKYAMMDYLEPKLLVF
jgi:glyceraldehyde-3-phosphate dehydrogenase (NADP+)